MAEKRKAVAIEEGGHKRAKRNDQPVRPSPLLQLPAELRNSIYEYSLTNATDVEITRGLKQPPLLSTCRQIRKEALKIWYLSNEFVTLVTDCDASLLKSFDIFLWSAGVGESAVVKIRTSGKHWANLVAWCRAIFQSQAHALEFDRNIDLRSDEAVVQAAHKIAMLGTAWDECEEALADLRFLAGQFDGEWLL